MTRALGREPEVSQKGHLGQTRTYCIQRAVAEGPNHSPGYFPQAAAPWRTKLWIEYGARGSSANRLTRRASSASRQGLPRRQSAWRCQHRAPKTGVVRDGPLPNRNVAKALARRLWPDLIMQPHPLSDVKPAAWSPSRRLIRIDSESAEAVLASLLADMGSKSDLYVIQNLELKSSRKPQGQPPESRHGSPDDAAGGVSDAELLLDCGPGADCVSGS